MTNQDYESELHGQVITPVHDFDQEYADGAHWDIGRPSTNMPDFVALLHEGDLVLDAGCGTGRDTFYLASLDYEVVGVDGSKVGIETARNRMYAAEDDEEDEIDQTPEPRFEVGEIEDLPYDDGIFDAAYTGYVIGGETFPVQIAELARVLKEGGVLFVAMFAETKYETPGERDEFNPPDFIQAAIEPHFKLEKEDVIEYGETDDVGHHTHKRLRMVLRKKPLPRRG